MTDIVKSTDHHPGQSPDGKPASLLKALVRLARPRQWIKNLLVYMAAASAGVLSHWSIIWHCTAAFGIFCLAASGTYYINDAIDAPSDRIHPTKRRRPVAAGLVPVEVAVSAGVGMLVVSIGLATWLAGWHLGVVMAAYAIINIAYSLGIKNEPILDLAAVASGFVLRAVAGGLASKISLSDWFLIVVSFGSLLLVTGKRSGEKQLLTDENAGHAAIRQTLDEYTVTFLRTVRCVTAAVSVSAYCLWAFERASHVHPGHNPIWFQFTIVPFVIALLHILRLLDSGAGAAPEDLVLRDHRLQIYGLCWIFLFAIGAYVS